MDGYHVTALANLMTWKTAVVDVITLHLSRFFPTFWRKRMDTITVKQFQAGYCFSYLLNSNNEYVLIDPHITLIADYRKELENKGTLKAIIDTHTHADHISSAFACSKEFQAPIYMSPKALCDFNFERVDSGDRIPFGDTALEVIGGAGHTDDSIVLSCDGNVFTGDVLLINSVGRCDFQNGSPESMYTTLQELKKRFTDETLLWPAHDYNGRNRSSIGEQKQENPFLAEMTKDNFVTLVTAKEIPKPTDMDMIINTNRHGASIGLGKLSPQEVQEKLTSEEGWTLVDVRTSEEYMGIHIEPSLNIPMAQVNSRLTELNSIQKKIILTCRTGTRANAVANALLGAGMQNIYLLDGAVTAWKKAGLPVVSTGPRLSLQQQVHTIAGAMAATGALLSILVNSWWVLLCLMVGCGMMFAGLTGTCMMGEILLRMPWNRIEINSNQATGGGCSLDGGGCAISAGDKGGDSGGGCSL